MLPTVDSWIPPQSDVRARPRAYPGPVTSAAARTAGGEPGGRSLPSRPGLADIGFTALLLLLMVGPVVLLGAGNSSSVGGLVVLVLGFALVIPLAWRRSHPAVSAATVYTAGLVQVVVDPTLQQPASVAVLVALYSVTAYGPRWAARVGLGGGIAGVLLLAALAVRGDPVDALLAAAMITVTGAALVLSAWALGAARRSRLAALAALRERAVRLEVERDQQVQLATAAERARIAREMHDIVAHSLSVVIAQADGGRYAAATDPAAAERSLTTIAETGRAALADMRRLLGVLRTDVDPSRDARAGNDAGNGVRNGTGTAVADLVPQPDAAQIDTLVEQVRASGMRVSLVRVGTPRPLPPGIGVNAHRICQEALTNVLKHAGPDPAVTVVERWAPDRLVLEISDDGRGAAAEDDGGGHGLVGMRERAALFGGTLRAGPRPGGGFAVHAEIPLPAVVPSTTALDGTSYAAPPSTGGLP